MNFADLLDKNDPVILLISFYRSWQKFEEKIGSYFSSKDIFVADFLEEEMCLSFEFKSLKEVSKAAHDLLDCISNIEGFSQSKRKLKHSINFLNRSGTERIREFLKIENHLFPEISIEEVQIYSNRYQELISNSLENDTKSVLDGKSISKILENEGLKIVQQLGCDNYFPLEVIETHTNDGWMILVCVDKLSPKIFVQTNPNNQYPLKNGFFEVLVHEMAHFCHFSLLLNKKKNKVDVLKYIFSLHTADGFFIEGIAQYITEIIFQRNEINISERTAKALWELKSAIMYYSMFHISHGNISLKDAAAVHVKYLGDTPDLIGHYKFLINDRMMSTQMFNYFGSLKIFKDQNIRVKPLSSIIEELSCIFTPEEFTKSF